MSRRPRTLLGAGLLLAGLLLAAPAAHAAVYKLSVYVTVAGDVGTGVVLDLSVDLDAGTVRGSGTSKSNDGYGTETETLELSGTIDRETGEIQATIKSNYSYVIDAENFWKKAYSGTFKAKMQTAGSVWLGSGTFTFSLVKRVGSVGNEEPVQGKSYPADVAIRAQGNASLPISLPEEIRATTTSVSGDAKYSKDGGKTWQPLTAGTVIEQGWVVYTNIDAVVALDFGYGTLRIAHIGSFRVDEYSSSKNLRRTQLYLNVGTVEAKVKHTNAGRSDFSVHSPTANASIRGSEMVVSVEKDTGATTVYAVEDVAYVKGKNDPSEIEVAQGQKVVVAADGKASAASAFTPAELPSVAPPEPSAGGSGTGSGTTGTGSGSEPVPAIAIGAIVVIAVAGLLLAGIRRRKPAGRP